MLVGVDLETTGLKWWEDTIISASIVYEDGTEQYFDLRTCDRDEAIVALKRATLDNEPVFHNAKFDIHFLRKVFDISPPVKNINDSMVAAHLIDEEARMSLRYQTERYFDDGFEFKDQLKTFKKRGKPFSFADLPEEFLRDYCLEDSRNTLRLFQVLRQKLVDETLFRTYRFEMEVLHVLLLMEERGVKVDVNYVLTICKDVEKEMNDLTDKIEKIVGRRVNLGSPKQVLGFVNKMYELELTSVTEIPIEIPFASDLERYRSLVHTFGTFKGFLARLDGDRLHCDFSQVRARTGRVISLNPSLQNLPVQASEFSIRRAIIGDGEVTSIDCDQMELRVVAMLSRDANLIEAFFAGRDVYAEAASVMYNIDISRAHDQMPGIDGSYRNIAKGLVLGLCFGLGPRNLARSLGVAYNEGQVIWNRFFDVYRGVAHFKLSSTQSIESVGFVRTLFGRKRRLPSVASYKAPNARVQGTAAGFLKLMMIIAERLVPGKLVLPIHDELIFEGLTVIQRGLLVERLGFEYVVPIKFKVKVGDNLQDLEVIDGN